MITENTLRVKMEVTGDGQLTATMGGAAQSITAVDKAQQGAAESAGAMAQAGRDNASATQAVGESAAEAEARINAMVRASLERQQAEATAATASTRGAEANQRVTLSLQEQVAAHQRAMAAADAYRQRSAAANRTAGDTSGIDAERGALAKLVGEIDPTIAALEKLDQQQAKLDRFRRQGVIGLEDYKQFSAVIDQSRERITSAGAAMHSFSLNNAMARRELGYLVKDLAMGNFGRFQQSALTLASSSGLMGMAFSAVGLAIAGVLVPLAAFALAAVKGYEESERLRVSVVATGNAAGVSGPAYDRMAASIGAATGEYGKARDTVDQLAASGKVAGAGIGMLAKQAVDMSTVTGESIDKSVAKILELSERPAAAIAKLNEQYHFLTSAQYAEIAALEAEGNTRAAARLADRLDAQAMADRAHDVEDNANVMVRAGHAVATAWGAAWEAMKSPFRAVGLGDQVAAVEAQIKALTTPRVDRQGNLVQAEGGAQLAALQQQLKDLRAKQWDAGLADVNQSADARANQDAIAAQQRLAKFASPETVRDNALAQANTDRLAAMYGVVDPAQKARIQSEYERQVKDAKTAYDSALKKDAGPRAKDPYASLDQQVSGAYSRNADTGTKELDAEAAALRAIAVAGADAIAKGGDIATVQAKVAAAVAQTTDYYGRQTTELDKANAADKAYRDTLQEKLAVYEEDARLRVQSVGMSQREIALQRELIAVHREAAQQMAQLNRERDAGHLTDAQFNQRKQENEAYEAQRVAAAKAADTDIAAAHTDWTRGAIAALKDYGDAAADVASQVGDGFTQMAGDMENSLASWAQGGSLSLKSFEKDFENMVAHMVAKALVAQATTALIGMFAPSGTGMVSLGGDTSYLGNSYNTGSYGGGYSLATAGHAEGGRISGPGTGTSDDILARLSNGENVITAKATDYYGQRFMDDLNAMRLPRYAEGGRVGVAGGGYGQPAPQITVINNGNDQVSAKSEQQPDGRWATRFVIDTVVADIAAGGKSAKAMQGRYGLQRRGVPVSGS